MPNIPKFQKGKFGGGVSTAELNAVMEAIQKLVDFQPGFGLEGGFGTQGLNIALKKNILSIIKMEAVILITKVPTPTSTQVLAEIVEQTVPDIGLTQTETQIESSVEDTGIPVSGEAPVAEPIKESTRGPSRFVLPPPPEEAEVEGGVAVIPVGTLGPITSAPGVPDRAPDRGDRDIVNLEEGRRSRGPLTVRKVKYKVYPPSPTEIEWDGDEFDAFPDFGLQAEDYTDFIWTEDNPQLRATYLVAKNDESYWRVELPSKINIEFVVVWNIGTGLEELIQVRDINVNNTTGAYEYSSATIRIVKTWPKFFSAHYAPFVFNGAAIDNTAKIIPMIRIGGRWYAFPIYRFAPQLEELASVTTSDCGFAQPG